MSRRRPRKLTPEESALWRRVARTATAMRGAASDPGPGPEAGPGGDGAADPASPAPAQARRPVPRGVAGIELAPDPVEALRAASARAGGRAAERLRRGRLEPEARLDLHGMTRQRAHAALTAFVLSAQARGLRLVLVITGKGRPDTGDAVIPERHGVLRHSLPHWLAAPPLAGRVLDLRSAHRRHGGAGAVYLTLRRRG